MLRLETAVWDEGYRHIAGLDEAGRGAIAGPVVAAAVILPLDKPDRLAALAGVNDSKQLTARQRERLFELITTHATAYAVASSDNDVVDAEGIIGANALAMGAAVTMLEPAPDYLLIDGRMRLRRLALPQRSVVRGDSLSLSIAAASILAKVSRDRMMVALDVHYPAYGFARHKGYCTAAHVAALAEHGPCPLHRFTFAPIRRPLL